MWTDYATVPGVHLFASLPDLAEQLGEAHPSTVAEAPRERSFFLGGGTC